MSQQRTESPSAIGEFALWMLAGLFVSPLGLMAVGTAKYLLGWSDTQWVVGSVAVGVLSLTWGSWAALLWTRSRVLQTLMIAAVVVPAILMIIAGGWAFINIPDNRWVWKWGWLILAGHGAGALAVALYVCSRGLVGASTSAMVRSRQLVVGWTLYPLVVVFSGVGIIAATYALLPNLLAGDDGLLHTLAIWVVPSQGLALVTTVIPAAAAHLCDRLTRS